MADHVDLSAVVVDGRAHIFDCGLEFAKRALVLYDDLKNEAIVNTGIYGRGRPGHVLRALNLFFRRLSHYEVFVFDAIHSQTSEV